MGGCSTYKLFRKESQIDIVSLFIKLHINRATWPSHINLRMVQVQWLQPRRQLLIRRDKGETSSLHFRLFTAPSPIIDLSPLLQHVARLGLAIRCCNTWLPVAATDSVQTNISVELAGSVPPTLHSPVPPVRVPPPVRVCLYQIILNITPQSGPVWYLVCLARGIFWLCIALLERNLCCLDFISDCFALLYPLCCSAKPCILLPSLLLYVAMIRVKWWRRWDNDNMRLVLRDNPELYSSKY